MDDMRDENGRFLKGHGGRKPNSKNKVITRTRISSLIESNWQRFDDELKTLKGRAYVEAFIKLLPFQLPTYSAIQFNIRNLDESDLEFLLERLKSQLTNEQED